jgi:hypothetical protein
MDIVGVNGQNVQMYQGNTLELDVFVVDCNDLPLDLTTYSGMQWVVYRPTTKEIVLTKSLGSGITMPEGAAASGLFLVSIEPEDTENLIAGRYIHEGKIWSDADHEFTVVTGSFEIAYSRV